ncbi:MAG: GAF domain-containing protein, partial [Dehalococcoidia bacterium]|nr:GAF domain-containing protein [Dehalococcoidia bacterium]
SVASQLAMAYEKANLSLEVTRRAERRAAMSRISAAISKTLNVETIYATLIQELQKLVEYDRLSVAELKGEQLELSVVSKDYSGYLGQGMRISPDNQMFYSVVREGKPVIRRNLETEAVQPIDQQLLAAGIRSVILIPLVAGGRTFGSLNLGSSQKNKYSETDLEYLQPVADQLAVALDNARLFKQVETAAGEWRDTFDAMDDGIALLSIDLRVQRVNRAMARLAGTTPQALLGQYCYTVFHGLDTPLSGCPGICCLNEKQPCDIVREEPPQGNRWFHMRCDPILDKNAKVVSLVHTIRDITEEKLREEKIERLHNLSKALSTSLSLETIYKVVMNELYPVIGYANYTICFILLDDLKQELICVAARGLYQEQFLDVRIPLNKLPVEVLSLLMEHKPVLFHNDPSISPDILKRLPHWDEFHSFTFFPLIVLNETIGMVIIMSDDPKPLPDTQVDFMVSCASQIAMAIENARLYGQMEATLSRRVKELQTLTDVLTVASQGLDLNTIMSSALKRAAEALGVERASIAILDESGKLIHTRAIWQQSAETPIETGLNRELADNPIWQKVLIEGQYVVTEDTELITDTKRREQVKRLGIRSALMVPLKISGRIIGSIQFNTMNGPRTYSSDEISLAKALAGHFAYIIENAKLYERTEKERSTLQAIISSMGEGLVVVDAQHKIAYCNQSAEDVLDIQASNVIGQPLNTFETAWMGRLNDMGIFSKQWTEAIVSQAKNIRIEFEFFAKGNKHSVEAVVFRIGDGQHSLGTGMLLRDITHEREIDRMKTEFVSIASHELRTPMTVIYGFSELLLKIRTLPQEQKEWVERIYKESQRLTAIVDDFLNVTRIESGRLSLHLGPVSLKPIVTQLLNQISSNYRYHNFHVEIPEDFPMVVADADRLTQVLYNLIDNAAKYSPEGGPVVILAKKADNGNQAIISVSDKGLGIPEDEVPKLFTRFHRVYRPEVNAIRGTGLGLSIVKSLIEMMGGEVWADSKVNQGSNFYIALPLYNTVPEAPNI